MPSAAASSSPRDDVIVLGAGMVGTATALQLARRGHAVCLVDRREPGRETSYGNAGLIQCEAREPYPFPRDAATLLPAALRRSTAIHYHADALPGLAAPLARYWWNSAPVRHQRAVAAYSALIGLSLPAHKELMAESGAGHLARHHGYHWVFRSAAGMDKALTQAQRLQQRFGVRHEALDGAALARREPGLQLRLHGAIHWPDPRPVVDPGALVAAYAARLQALGGRVLQGDAGTLEAAGAGWQVSTSAGLVQARHAVLALGPWSGQFARRLGYRVPLFVKRGYHRHFRGGPGLNAPLLDSERGYVLAPMAQGLRLTTGAEFARLDAPATPLQMGRATAAARELIALSDPVEEQPWLGNRPCLPDMLPVIGAAPRHAGLWFNFGHAHQGFTMGPACGQLLAEMLADEATSVDPTPYAIGRFSPA